MSSRGSRAESTSSDAADERLVAALREAAGSRMVLVSRLEASAGLHSKCTQMAKQVLALSHTISEMREQEAQLLGEIDHLKDELADARRGAAADDGAAAEIAQLRAENASLRAQCMFMQDEVRTSVAAVAASSKRATTLAAMIAANS